MPLLAWPLLVPVREKDLVDDFRRKELPASPLWLSEHAPTGKYGNMGLAGSQWPRGEGMDGGEIMNCDERTDRDEGINCREIPERGKRWRGGQGGTACKVRAHTDALQGTPNLASWILEPLPCP